MNSLLSKLCPALCIGATIFVSIQDAWSTPQIVSQTNLDARKIRALGDFLVIAGGYLVTAKLGDSAKVITYDLALAGPTIDLLTDGQIIHHFGTTWRAFEMDPKTGRLTTNFTQSIPTIRCATGADGKFFLNLGGEFISYYKLTNGTPEYQFALHQPYWTPSAFSIAAKITGDLLCVLASDGCRLWKIGANDSFDFQSKFATGPEPVGFKVETNRITIVTGVNGTAHFVEWDISNPERPTSIGSSVVPCVLDSEYASEISISDDGSILVPHNYGNDLLKVTNNAGSYSLSWNVTGLGLGGARTQIQMPGVVLVGGNKVSTLASNNQLLWSGIRRNDGELELARIAGDAQEWGVDHSFNMQQWAGIAVTRTADEGTVVFSVTATNNFEFFRLFHSSN